MSRTNRKCGALRSDDALAADFTESVRTEKLRGLDWPFTDDSPRFARKKSGMFLVRTSGINLMAIELTVSTPRGVPQVHCPCGTEPPMVRPQWIAYGITRDRTGFHEPTGEGTR